MWVTLRTYRLLEYLTFGQWLIFFHDQDVEYYYLSVSIQEDKQKEYDDWRKKVVVDNPVIQLTLKP